jgi:hypothetical protein
MRYGSREGKGMPSNRFARDVIRGGFDALERVGLFTLLFGLVFGSRGQRGHRHRCQFCGYKDRERCNCRYGANYPNTVCQRCFDRGLYPKGGGDTVLLDR